MQLCEIFDKTSFYESQHIIFNLFLFGIHLRRVRIILNSISLTIFCTRWNAHYHLGKVIHFGVNEIIELNIEDDVGQMTTHVRAALSGSFDEIINDVFGNH